MCGMTSSVFRTRYVLYFMILGAITSGCRSYGGYGSETATYEQILRLHRVFEEDLLRARADLSILEREASVFEDLQGFAEAYDEIVRGHEATVERFEGMLADLSSDSDYRRLRRVFGAAVANHRKVRKQYRALLWHAYRSFVLPETANRFDRPYALIPPYYRRIQYAERELTLNDVLAAVRSRAAAANDPPSSDPDTSAVNEALSPEAEGNQE